MEVANKLVTLADLKAAYDNLKATCEDLRRKANMWEDITDQLTFSAATWNVLGYSGNDWVKNTSDVMGSSASISVVPGERYKVTGWTCHMNAMSSDRQTAFLAAVTNSSGNILSGYSLHIPISQRQGNESYYYKWTYDSREIVIPKNARTLVVFSFGAVRGMGSSVDDVILEKLVQ